MSRNLDVIIFGASGYTGKYAIISAYDILKEYKWAVAGRNKQKLQDTIKDVSDKIKQDLSAIPIVIADINDEKSLTEMTKQAKVIVNCCGPYRFFGEQVVKACIETATSHVDVSAEPQYMETMQLKYDEEARERGIYIVTACGFYSIPADLGIVYLQKKFNGTLNSVDLYAKFSCERATDLKGADLRLSTFLSKGYEMAHANDLKQIRQELFKDELPTYLPMPPKRSIHKHQIIDAWCIPDIGADYSSIMRSQRYFYENDNQRPIQIQTYSSVVSLFKVFKFVIIALIFFVFSKSLFGLKIFKRYVKYLTFGSVSHEGPSEKKINSLLMELYLIGNGWKEKLCGSTDQFNIPMNKEMIVKVTSLNPYISTCNPAILAAKMILEESDKMPKNGGVFPPAAAFSKTSLLNELKNYGYTFEVIKSEED